MAKAKTPLTSLRQLAKRVLPRPVVDWLRKRRGSAAAKKADTEARHVLLPEIGPGVEYMTELEGGLWSTGDPMYVEKLERAVRLTGRGSRSRAHGSLALARWDFSQGDLDLALRRLEGVQPSDPTLQAKLDLFRADCLCDLRQGQQALALLSRMTGRYTADQNLLLRVGHARSLLVKSKDHGSGPVAEGINGIYAGAGFGMIRRRSVLDPMGLDNISCDVREAEPVESLPLVTIIVWVPESLPEVQSGVSSLLDQSWKNLEVLIVGRPDVRENTAVFDSPLTVEDRLRFIDGDGDTDRILAAAMAHATGEMVTTHLYGSWAHPQRIEAQATTLSMRPSLLGTVSSHMNVSSALEPRPLGATPRPDLVGPDPHSAMIRTSGMTPGEVIAAYDRVSACHSPVTGDLEPPDGIAIVNQEVPLTLTLATARPIRKEARAVSS